MSFLTPLFLLGALAVTLPLVFHLVRRSARDRMPFSSLMFLRASPPRVNRRSRFEHILLLLLRCLVVCLLALAFARPFFQKPVTAQPATQGGARIVVLVDASASMRRQDLWEAALAKARDALRQASVSDEVALLLFDDQVRTLFGFQQWTGADVRERFTLARASLADQNPSWRSTHLGNALLAAAEMIEDADRQAENTGPRRIVLISDLQEGSRLDGLQGYDWPRGIEVVLEPVTARRVTNAGLQWVSDVEPAPGDADAGPRLRVSNSADAQREQFLIQWLGDSETVDAYVPPGQSRIVQAPKYPQGVAEQIMLSGDDDPFDNSVHVVQPQARRSQVLYVGEDAPGDSGEMLFYLDRAFPETHRHSVQITKVTPNALSNAVLATNRLAFITAPLPEDRVALVRQFADGGGTVLLVMKDASFAQMAAALTGIAGVTASEASTSNYAMITRIDSEHPLFAPFADPRYGDFTKIHFWKHRRLQVESLPEARVLAWFDSGDPALVEIPRGQGRLLVLASTWRPADSQLALSSRFVPLMYSILEQAGGLGAQMVQYRVGDSVNLSALAVNSGSALIIRKPDGSRTQISAAGVASPSPPSRGEEGNRSQKLSFQPDQPGIYEVASAQEPIRFAVNLDAAESRTMPLALDTFDRLKVPLKAPERDRSRVVEQHVRLQKAELETQQKLWRWLIVVAMVVLTLETWMAGRLTGRA